MSISTSGQSGETGLDLFLYPNEQYFDALRNDIAVAEAGGRILVGTMDLNPNEAMAQEVVTHLCTASNRGVDATLAIDAIMLYGARCRGMVLTPFYRDENLYNRRSDFLHSIEATSRLQTRLINEPVGSFANIFRNRFHIKPGIVNDKVYITGANLDRTDRMDMTVGFEDRQTADWLFETISAVAESGTTEVLGGDKVWQLDGQTQIFLDAGKPNQSTIS